MQPKGGAIRKRTQIAMANRTMFLWVAGVSVLVGFAAVGSIFLFQKLLFNERVLGEKNTLITVLQRNNENVKELESEIRLLDTNQALISVKANPEDRAIQVILDALPSEANSFGFGASIQKKLLETIPGLKILKLDVDPVPGVESLAGSGSQNVALTSSSLSQNAISFTLTVITEEDGNVEMMKKVLTNLEKSIRTIDIVKLKIIGKTQLTVEGWGYYEPSKEVELKDMVVK